MTCLKRSFLGLFAVLFGCVACELSESDLDAFQTTASGPAKIRAVLEDASRNPALRASAAMMLLDLDRHDLQGPEELGRELSKLSEASRARLALPLSHALLRHMETSAFNPPSARALRAKGAATAALPLLNTMQRTAFGGKLIRWVVADVATRGDAGGSVEALAQSLGAGSAEPLLEGLRSDVPNAAVLRLSVLLDRHAAPALRPRIAARLLEISQGHGTPQALLEALGHFADQAEVRAALVKVGSDPTRATTDRTEALTLLAGHATPTELPPLLHLLLDDHQDVALREVAVARAGETRSSEALPGLLVLLSNRTHARLRTLAGGFVLDVGGPKTLPAFLRALPRDWTVPYGRAEIDAYSQHIDRFTPDIALLMFMGSKLHASQWWARVLALRYFAAQGSSEDLWRIRRHTHDTAPIQGEGWPRGYDVGQEAERCVNALNERLLRPR